MIDLYDSRTWHVRLLNNSTWFSRDARGESYAGRLTLCGYTKFVILSILELLIKISSMFTLGMGIGAVLYYFYLIGIDQQHSIIAVIFDASATRQYTTQIYQMYVGNLSYYGYIIMFISGILEFLILTTISAIFVTIVVLIIVYPTYKLYCVSKSILNYVYTKSYDPFYNTFNKYFGKYCVKIKITQHTIHSFEDRK